MAANKLKAAALAKKKAMKPEAENKKENKAEGGKEEPGCKDCGKKMGSCSC